MSDDSAFLSPGTEVSAKFKGVFCEAKIKELCKSVALKEAPFGSIVVEEHLIRGTLEVNQTVDVSHGKQQLKGVIQHTEDCSTYYRLFITTICNVLVFNYGDEKVLRRTQLCLKGTLTLNRIWIRCLYIIRNNFALLQNPKQRRGNLRRRSDVAKKTARMMMERSEKKRGAAEAMPFVDFHENACLPNFVWCLISVV
ncbi:hypothetical protein ANCCAN_03870 [Ancylostoma caninum]|uniref:Uncharacterized protein n=1 Tax=Ancylostoma caninum TaxID=29170 RepID=A0A368H450_ANCCA|nr:hypothetical protein ANCCAN_03870 [Ancylostoma caninum]